MKKIAVNTVKAFLKENKHDNVCTKSFPVGDGNEFEVQIKTRLTTAEKSAFINRVLSGCFDAKGDYRPEYVVPMIRATVLQMCTNLPVLTLKNEQADGGESLMDLDAMNDLFVALNDSGCSELYGNLYDDMSYLCEEAIDWKRAHTLSDHSMDAALRRLMDTLTSKVDGMDLNGLTKYAAELSRATKNLDEDGLLKGIVEFGQKKTQGNVIDISDKAGSAE